MVRPRPRTLGGVQRALPRRSGRGGQDGRHTRYRREGWGGERHAPLRRQGQNTTTPGLWKPLSRRHSISFGHGKVLRGGKSGFCGRSTLLTGLREAAEVWKEGLEFGVETGSIIIAVQRRKEDGCEGSDQRSRPYR